MLFLEPEPVSDEPKKQLINKWNPWEVRERTKAKILKLLSDNRDREWSVTEIPDEM